MGSHVPVRTCVGCRERAPQAALERFVRRNGAWEHDLGRARSPGRGAYVCSGACATRVQKNKRYAGLAAAAGAVAWGNRTLCEAKPVRV